MSDNKLSNNKVKKLVNVENIAELNKSFTTYQELINYYRSFSKKYYRDQNIYCEGHHIVPRAEGGTDADGIIYLDLKHHAIAHILRAEEYYAQGDLYRANQNFAAVKKILGAYKNRWSTDIPEELIKQVEVSKHHQWECQSAKAKRDKLTWVTNGVENHRFPKEKALKYVEEHEGWSEGRTYPEKGVWVTDGISKKEYLKPSEVQAFLEAHPDWRRGQGPNKPGKHNSNLLGSFKGRKWMHKGSERKGVVKEEVEKYLAQGWELGSGNSKSSTSEGNAMVTSYRYNLRAKATNRNEATEFLKQSYGFLSKRACESMFLEESIIHLLDIASSNRKHQYNVYIPSSYYMYFSDKDWILDSSI